MNSAPACAGQSTQTFLLKVGERVFLCLKTGTEPLAYSSQSSAISRRQQLIVESSPLTEKFVGGPAGQARPLPRGARRPPRGCRAGTPELTTPLWSTTTGTGIPEGFRPASPGRAAPEARKRGSRWTKNSG
jgi:hypothetical protein